MTMPVFELPLDLMRPEVGKIDLFRAAFPSQQFPRHFHDCHMIKVVTQGETGGVISGKPYANATGSIFLSNPNEVHTGASAGAVRYIAFYIPGDIVRSLAPRGARSCSFARAAVDDARLSQQLCHLHSDLFTSAASWTALEERLAHLFRTFAEPTPPFPLDRRVRRTLRTIHERGCETLSVESLARAVSLSRNQLTRLFTQSIGLPPAEYGLNWRLESARQALHGGVSIAHTASAHGFSDQSHFTKLFRRYFGLPPAAYLASAIRV